MSGNNCCGNEIGLTNDVLKMIKRPVFFWFLLMIFIRANAGDSTDGWRVAVLPSSVRIDPSTHRVYDQPYTTLNAKAIIADSLLKNNWIYNGKVASLQGARGEYVSFQLVLTNNSKKPLKGIEVGMKQFNNNRDRINILPELFL